MSTKTFCDKCGAEVSPGDEFHITLQARNLIGKDQDPIKCDVCHFCFDGVAKELGVDWES